MCGPHTLLSGYTTSHIPDDYACRLRNYIQESENHRLYCRSHHSTVKFGTESVVMQSIRFTDFYAGSRERFSSHVSGRYENTCSSHLPRFTSLV